MPQHHWHTAGCVLNENVAPHLDTAHTLPWKRTPPDHRGRDIGGAASVAALGPWSGRASDPPSLVPALLKKTPFMHGPL